VHPWLSVLQGKVPEERRKLYTAELGNSLHKHHQINQIKENERSAQDRD
jgi:hypothetical protein